MPQVKYSPQRQLQNDFQNTGPVMSPQCKWNKMKQEQTRSFLWLLIPFGIKLGPVGGPAGSCPSFPSPAPSPTRHSLLPLSRMYHFPSHSSAFAHTAPSASTPLLHSTLYSPFHLCKGCGSFLAQVLLRELSAGRVEYTSCISILGRGSPG